jgi:hypothetical protein
VASSALHSGAAKDLGKTFSSSKNETIAQLLTIQDCIRVQEKAFRKLPTGGAICRPRIDVYFPCEREDGYFR